MRISGNNVKLENLAFLQNVLGSGNELAGGEDPEFQMVIESHNVVLKNCLLICSGNGILLKENSKLTLINCEIIRDTSSIYDQPGIPGPGPNSRAKNKSGLTLDNSVGILKMTGSKLFMEDCKIKNFSIPVQVLKIVQDDTVLNNVECDGRLLISRVGHIDRNEAVGSALESDIEKMVEENKPVETEAAEAQASAENETEEAQPEPRKAVTESPPPENPEPRHATVTRPNDPASGDVPKKSLKSSTDKNLPDPDSDVASQDNIDPFNDGDYIKNLKVSESRESLKKYNITLNENVGVDNVTVI